MLTFLFSKIHSESEKIRGKNKEQLVKEDNFYANIKYYNLAKQLSHYLYFFSFLFLFFWTYYTGGKAGKCHVTVT